MPSVPPLPQASETIEEVFLTPRVLDGRAFEDYSASLTRLIKDASAEGQTLSRTAADVRVLKEQLGEAAGEAQRRLDTATLAHLADMRERITRALDAAYIRRD